MYGKLIDGTLYEAPKRIVLGAWQIFNPADEHLAQAGYLPVVETEMPELEENQYAIFSYVQQDDQIVKVWSVQTEVNADGGNE